MSFEDLYEQRKNFFLKMSATTRGGLTFFCLLGVLTLAFGFYQDSSRAWGSFLFNLMFFFSLAVGGIAFGHMQDVIGALWGRPVKRLHESFGAFLPWACGLMVVFLVCIRFDILGGGKVYSWIADPHMLDHFHGKNVWLQPNFWMIRDIAAVIIIYLLAMWHRKKTLGGDLLLLEGKKEESVRFALQAKKDLRYWSAPILVVYGVLFSLLVFDLTMSLAPTWFSTLWGGWSFALMMQSLMAFILIMMFALKQSPMGYFYQRQHFHDIGKLMHGFTAFFAYLTYAHVLTYWYINMPEETSYFLTRLVDPWLSFVIAAPFLCFLIPFILLIPKVSKWTKPLTISICLIILLSQWLNYLLVVIPETTRPEDWQFPWLEMGTFAGFLGLFMISIFRFGKSNPMISISDPLLKDSLSAHH